VRWSPLEPVPSLALGSSPVTLLEMVNAYGSIANSGRYIPPQLVTRIENADGELLAEFTPPKPDQVWDEEELRSAGDDARRDRQGHGPRDSQAIRHSRRCGRQDRHHPGQCRRLVHPHAPADRGRCLGRLQRCAHHAQERPMGPGSRSALPMVGDFMSRAMRSRCSMPGPFTEPNTSHWWSDLVAACATRFRNGAARQEGNDPDRTAPTAPAHPAPNRSNGSEVDIIESTPAAPPRL
jgi:penicillin-binding protein 1A